MTRRSSLLLALAVVALAVAGVALAPHEPRDVALSARSASPAASGGVVALDAYEAEYERETERLAATPSPELRDEVARLGREAANMASERRRYIDEEDYDPGDVALYDEALRNLRLGVNNAYYELDGRGELTASDRAAWLRGVDVADAREDVEAQRAERDRYAREARPSPDYADQLAVREAAADEAEARLRGYEARLRMAERDAGGR